MSIHYETLIDSINVGIITVDADLTIHYINKWVAVHSKIDPDDVQGQNLLNVFEIPEEKLKSLKRHIKAALTLHSPSFLTADANGYLLAMQHSMTIKSAFEFMQQDVTIVPYDLEKKIRYDVNLRSNEP